MGSYLKFNDRENNSKSISFLFSDLIKKVFKDNKDDKLCKIELGLDGWSFNKRGIAKLIINVKFLLNEQNNYENLDFFYRRKQRRILWRINKRRIY